MKIKENEIDKLFFTSDPHFYHGNIIQFCSRPFADVEDMNKELIKNWNKVVPEDGKIFILGDIAFTGSIPKVQHVIEQLNGYKYLIYGNHDYQNRLNRPAITDLFVDTFDMLELSIEDTDAHNDQRITLCHYPMCTWNHKISMGAWHLYGHIHSGPYSSASEGSIGSNEPAMYDVGMDNNDYQPISYNDVKIKITKQFLNNAN